MLLAKAKTNLLSTEHQSCLDHELSLSVCHVNYAEGLDHGRMQCNICTHTENCAETENELVQQGHQRIAEQNTGALLLSFNYLGGIINKARTESVVLADRGLDLLAQYPDDAACLIINGVVIIFPVACSAHMNEIDTQTLGHVTIIVQLLELACGK